MGKNKDLKSRVICPVCGKPFDNRVQGMLVFGHVWCDTCFHSYYDNLEK